MIYLKNIRHRWPGSVLGLANDKQNGLLERSKILCICFVWVTCVRITQTTYTFLHIFLSKQHGLPSGFVCRRINHALIVYSVPITHRWLEVNSVLHTHTHTDIQRQTHTHTQTYRDTHTHTHTLEADWGEERWHPHIGSPSTST